jgi:hypothetical protein
VNVHDPQPKGTFARSYTMVYAYTSNALLIVAAAAGWLVSAPGILSAVSPLLAVCALAWLACAALANVRHFGQRRGMSRRECALSTLATGGLSALVWVVAFLCLSALGADLV